MKLERRPSMHPQIDQPASRLRSQAKLVFGASLATGLQVGLLQAFLLQRWQSVVVPTVTSLFFGAVCLAAWQLVFPRIPRQPRARRIALQSAVAVLAMAVASFVVVNGTMLLLSGKWMFTPYTGGDTTAQIPAWVLSWAPFAYFFFPIIPAAFMMVVGFNQSWWQIFLLERSADEARELAALAQLEALRAQINPHFLFNSLNSIAQLISTDPDRAEQCVERLAEILRYLLRSENRSFVTLADELDIADAYLDIERARFGDRLDVDFAVEDGARHRFVPTLILQPLIENAVRHGVTPKVGGGRVSIEAAIVGEDLKVVVRDTGVGMRNGVAVALSSGVGLRNVYDRLVQLFGEKYAPQIVTRPGEGTSITVLVPHVISDSASATLH